MTITELRAGDVLTLTRSMEGHEDLKSYYFVTEVAPSIARAVCILTGPTWVGSISPFDIITQTQLDDPEHHWTLLDRRLTTATEAAA